MKPASSSAPKGTSTAPLQVPAAASGVLFRLKGVVHVTAPHTAKRPSGLRVTAEAQHFRHHADPLLLGPASAALLDYLFKTKVVEATGAGDGLLHSFALYYAAIRLRTVAARATDSVPPNRPPTLPQ